MKYTIDQQSLNKAIQNLQNRSDKALQYCWEYLTAKLQEQIKQDSYDLWTLARSIDYKLVRSGLVSVWSALAYAPVMEYWRKPWKFPPLDDLVWWTARKWMISWWATQKYDSLYYKDKWVVFLIARSIARKWIKWKHTFQNVLNRERGQIQKIYIEYMQRW